MYINVCVRLNSAHRHLTILFSGRQILHFI